MTQFNRVHAALALVMVVAFSTLAAGCHVIGDIFKAGAIVGVIAVVIVLGIIFWIAGKFRGK